MRVRPWSSAPAESGKGVSSKDVSLSARVAVNPTANSFVASALALRNRVGAQLIHKSVHLK